MGEIRERYWVFKRKARIGLTLVSKNEYFKSFFSMNCEHRVSAACFAIW
jgi:hypothetical protein